MGQFMLRSCCAAIQWLRWQTNKSRTWGAETVSVKAELVYRAKDAFGKGFIEVVIWRLPVSVVPSDHPFKYRLVYIVDGQRLVGYDNERGKGDHKHIGENECPYTWVNPKQLMADFLADVESFIE